MRTTPIGSDRSGIDDRSTLFKVRQRIFSDPKHGIYIGLKCLQEVIGGNVFQTFAFVMDRCIVHKNSIIAAGAVVLEGTVVEAGSIYAGVPAKKVKDISQELVHGEIDRIANNYVKYASWFSENNDAPGAK